MKWVTEVILTEISTSISQSSDFWMRHLTFIVHNTVIKHKQYLSQRKGIELSLVDLKAVCVPEYSVHLNNPSDRRRSAIGGKKSQSVTHRTCRVIDRAARSQRSGDPFGARTVVSHASPSDSSGHQKDPGHSLLSWLRRRRRKAGLWRKTRKRTRVTRQFLLFQSAASISIDAEMREIDQGAGPIVNFKAFSN